MAHHKIQLNMSMTIAHAMQLHMAAQPFSQQLCSGRESKVTH